VIIQVGGNTLDCDVEATVAAFSAYTPHFCDCNGYRNFRAAQATIFTVPVRDFFGQFGIDVTKPSEIYDLGPPEDSLLAYGGWFHFVGVAINDDDVIDVSEHLTIYFLQRPARLVGV